MDFNDILEIIDSNVDNIEDEDYNEDDKIVVKNEDFSDLEDDSEEDNIIKNEIEEPIIKVVSEDKPIKKVDIARTIYDREIKLGTSRKQIIELFINEAGLTKAGAATYYNNFHSKK